MRIFRYVVWLGLIGCLITYIIYYFQLRQLGLSGCISPGYPQSDLSRAVLLEWKTAGVAGLVGRLTCLDFFFIFCFVSVLIFISANRLRQEASPMWNSLLRANYFFAIVAGLAGITENGVMLYNLSAIDGGGFWNPWWLNWIKWLAAGWAIIVCLSAAVRSLFHRSP